MARVGLSGAGIAKVRGCRASVGDEEEGTGEGFEGGSLEAWQAGGSAGKLQNVKLKKITTTKTATTPSKCYSHRKTADAELCKFWIWGFGGIGICIWWWKQKRLKEEAGQEESGN